MFNSQQLMKQETNTEWLHDLPKAMLLVSTTGDIWIKLLYSKVCADKITYLQTFSASVY
jgi:hypothetical protein